MSEARQTAEALCEEVGVAQSLKRCARELALARRARSRRRFEFWTEIARLVEANVQWAEMHEANATANAAAQAKGAAQAKAVAELIEPFEDLAQRASLPRLAHLLALARAHAAKEANATTLEQSVSDLGDCDPLQVRAKGR